MGVAAFLEQEVDPPAVRREARTRDVAVEGSGQRRGVAAGRRHHRQMIGAVPHVPGIAAGDESDRTAVGAEDGGRGRAGIGGHRPRRLAAPGGHDVDVAVAARVRVGRTVARKGDPLRVGGPGRGGVVVGAARDLEACLPLHVEDVDVVAQLAQVSLAVALELQPADDDGPGRLLFRRRPVVGLLRRVGIGIGRHDGEPAAVG